MLAKTAMLVSDAAGGCRAGQAKIAHVPERLSTDERRYGDNHIHNVNQSCSRVKRWMLRFRGVATNYLDSYLGRHGAEDRAGSTQSASRFLAAAWG